MKALKLFCAIGWHRWRRVPGHGLEWIRCTRCGEESKTEWQRDTNSTGPGSTRGWSYLPPPAPAPPPPPPPCSRLIPESIPVTLGEKQFKPPSSLWIRFAQVRAIIGIWEFEPFPPDVLQKERIVKFTVDQQPVDPFDKDGCRNYDAGTAIAIVKAIDFLRLGEGDSVDILCDNADFNGQPNNAVECCCEWTDWKVRRFTGNTLLEALQAAVMQKRMTP